MAEQRNLCFVVLLLWVLLLAICEDSSGVENEEVSAVGDPGMRRDGLRLAIESWNQCNEVGDENPQMGSPRAADCFDVHNASLQEEGSKFS